MVACEDKVEYVCTGIAALKQEDARVTDEHHPALTGLTTHAEGTQAELS